MPNPEINKRDHNYSESEPSQHINNGNGGTVNRGTKMTPVVGQIRDIDELKKIAPRVRLQDAKSLNELTRISSLSNNSSSNLQGKLSISERTRQELMKYCRTCAGLKLPLIKKAEVKLKSIHVNLTTDNTGKKPTEPINDPSTTKQQRQLSSCLQKGEKRPLCENQEDSLPSKMKKECNSPYTTRQSTLSSLASSVKQGNRTIPRNQEEDSISTVSGIFSLKNQLKIDSCEETEARVMSGNIFEEVIKEEDEESIEEFDPDDPAFQDIEEDEAEASLKSPVVYKYDTGTKLYVRVDGNEGITVKSETFQDTRSPIPPGERENQREETKPDILKRRLQMPTLTMMTTTTTATATTTVTETGTVIAPTTMTTAITMTKNGENIETQNEIEGTLKECKIQKFDLTNPLSVNSAPEEDGIMYVTVKGSKPNELLLVKVKKMDKPIESKRIVNSTDVKPVDRFLKRYDTLVTREFPSRRTDVREQIIEEQIEEYKKKREKILGNQTTTTFAANEPSRKETHEEETSSLRKTEEEIVIVRESSEEKKVIKGEQRKDIEIVQIEESPEKAYDNADEYFSKFSKLKQKWEETKRKKENPPKELDESSIEGNLEKLERILGEKEKNLQEFQDYLKQRKIILSRLKDEDVISLYEDRFSTTVKSSAKPLPDLIDTQPPADLLPEERYLECDYCPDTFSSRDVLEEHLKSHDYRILHCCDDCGEEFPTNKAKRSHNVICVRKLICKYCDIILDSRGKKRQHEQKHVDTMYGQLCEVCGERFKHQGTLDQHLKTQHTILEKIYQCPKCPKRFAFKQKLSFHLKSVHTALRAYLCEDCGADFKNPASLRHHKIRKHQSVGNKRECPVCRKLVPFYSLSKHMHTHKSYSIQCPHCDKRFKNSSTLKQHVRIHEDQRQYRCDTCGVGFNRRDGLRLHMRVHEKTSSRGLKECSCQVCGEKFPNHSTLVMHRNRMHKDGRQYTCNICNRSMVSAWSLEWHMSHIHNESMPGINRDESGLPEKKRVSCYHCNKTFKTEMILRTHIKNTHMEKDPMKCDDCEATFTSEVRLRHHMMITHNRLEGTLACPHCPKRFVNQLRLKTHMISHSDERPYTCEICGFNLKTKIQLIKHHQNRHSDERPLQCRHCTWRCKQVSALVCHERTHTNERPYSCSVCRQRFKYLGDKNKHERRHESLGGSGFKRIVPGRNIKPKPARRDNSSGSEQEQISAKDSMSQQDIQAAEEQYEEQQDEQIVKFEREQIVKFEEQQEYGQVYEQENYEETSREASEATEVIMNMEDPNVYTEEVTADNIEPSAEMMTDEMMTNDILQSGTAVVHLQRQDDSGKIQVIPVVLSLPDLSDANAEVNLDTASIMYNN
ncbi:uncharacterized protein LOC105283158 isoform X2 [Ooceraea biroi]|uniref:uncharacterized protein LOC105283158 isoform X2 n=1 Tax=Ooceraea biroi TaxID=2015173 RepID=UPI000F07902C|nr:uncharacterized protein LOC105283158 isoform X2 [Ooceraea biroi]